MASRVSTAPPGLSLSGSRVTIYKHRELKPILSFDTVVSAAALKAQLEAKQRVRAWCEREREAATASERMSSGRSKSTSAPAPTNVISGKKHSASRASSSSSCGLSQAQIRALQARELTPEDYDMLLRLDETIEKRNVLSQSEAAALVESTLEADAECSVCLCDIASGEQCVLLGCGHHFHPGCIKDWLVKGKNTCPMCNTKASQGPG